MREVEKALIKIKSKTLPIDEKVYYSNYFTNLTQNYRKVHVYLIPQLAIFNLYWNMYYAYAIVLRLSSVNSQELLLLNQFLTDFNSVWFVWKSLWLCIKLPRGFEKF